MTIQHWDAERTTQRADELGRLLCDAVNGGASLGFLSPLDRDHAWAHWIEVSRGIAAGWIQLLVLEQAGEVIGTVQLVEARQADAGHRAEVAHLMVRSLYRQLGHGRQLMQAVQSLALARGRSTLVLNTRSGDRAERLFQALGWARSGDVPRFTRGADRQWHAATLYHLILENEPA